MAMDRCWKSHIKNWFGNFQFVSPMAWPVSCEREFSSLQREVSDPLQPGSAVFLFCKREKIPFAKESRSHDTGQYLTRAVIWPVLCNFGLDFVLLILLAFVTRISLDLVLFLDHIANIIRNTKLPMSPQSRR
jgi:hypothetical protein